MTDKPAQEQPLLGESPAFLAVLEQASRVAPLSKPVLIIGERGTGKELVASRLHFLSSRWDMPLVKLNCAALAESLLETELFGHEAGAFTGARTRHQGRFEQADGGSLFLDELANTSSSVQEKILRVIEYGEFERVGGSKTLEVDVRLIGATNEDLPALAESGRFREDLLDRLAFDVLTLPPLRARPEDILPLAEHFAQRMVRELDRQYFPGFTSEARDKLLEYRWPGNVRELKNVVERAVYRTADPDEPVDEIQLDPFDSPYRPRSGEKTSKAAGTKGNGALPDGPLDYKDTVADFETRLLTRALEMNQYNQRRTAEYLGLTYDQLRGQLKKYDLLSK